MILPHRASRAISTMGAKVQCNPAAVASSAAILEDLSASSGSQLAASARGMGNMVR